VARGDVTVGLLVSCYRLERVRDDWMEETSHASFSEIRELPCLVESGVKYVLDAVSGDTGQKRTGRWYICVS